MKAPVKFILTVSIIFIYSFCKAQTPAQWAAFQRHELKECDYILGGKVIQQTKGSEATCSVIQITKIFRGNPQLKLGSIKVITTILNGSEKFPQLHNGSTYIIFGTVTNPDIFKSILTDNSLTLKSNDWIVFIGTGAEWGWRKASKYPTVDSLYSFFKENGLTVQEEIEKK